MEGLPAGGSWRCDMDADEKVHIPDWFGVNLDRIREAFRGGGYTLKAVVEAVDGRPSYGTVQRMMQEPTEEERAAG